MIRYHCFVLYKLIHSYNIKQGYIERNKINETHVYLRKRFELAALRYNVAFKGLQKVAQS